MRKLSTTSMDPWFEWDLTPFLLLLGRHGKVFLLFGLVGPGSHGSDIAGTRAGKKQMQKDPEFYIAKLRDAADIICTYMSPILFDYV